MPSSKEWREVGLTQNPEKANKVGEVIDLPVQSFHFTSEENKAQRRAVICPKPHRESMAEQE